MWTIGHGRDHISSFRDNGAGFYSVGVATNAYQQEETKDRTQVSLDPPDNIIEGLYTIKNGDFNGGINRAARSSFVVSRQLK